MLLLSAVVVLAIVLKTYNSFCAAIPLSVSLGFAAKTFVVMLLMSGAVFLLFRKKDTFKASLLAGLLVLLYGFGGDMLNTVKTLAPQSRLASYSLLLPLLLVLVVTVGMYLYRSSASFGKAFRFLRIYVLLLLAYELVMLGVNLSSPKSSFRNRLYSHEPLPAVTAAPVADLPDVYLIILDSYTSDKALQEQLHFDNSANTTALAAQGFRTGLGVRSNYAYTFLSVSSMLNGQLAQVLPDTMDVNTMLKAIENIWHNRLQYLFRDLGYDIRNQGVFGMDLAPISVPMYFDWVYDRCFDNHTLYGKVYNDIGWNFSTNKAIGGKVEYTDALKKTRERHVQNFIMHNYEALLQDATTTSGKPVFTYGHMILPHEPYYLDSVGKYYPDSLMLSPKLSPKERYLNHLRYANTLLQKMAGAFAADSRKKIVVILGDHGFRGYKEEAQKSSLFDVYCTVYNSSGLDLGRMDSTTNVNVMLNVVEAVSKQKLPRPADTSIFINDHDMFPHFMH